MPAFARRSMHSTPDTVCVLPTWFVNCGALTARSENRRCRMACPRAVWLPLASGRDDARDQVLEVDPRRLGCVEQPAGAQDLDADEAIARREVQRDVVGQPHGPTLGRALDQTDV